MDDEFEKWLTEGIRLNLQQYDTAYFYTDRDQMKWNKGAQNALEAARSRYRLLKIEFQEQARASEREKMRKEHRIDCHDCCDEHYEDGHKDGYKKGQADIKKKVRKIADNWGNGVARESLYELINEASESLGTGSYGNPTEEVHPPKPEKPKTKVID